MSGGEGLGTCRGFTAVLRGKKKVEGEATELGGKEEGKDRADKTKKKKKKKWNMRLPRGEKVPSRKRGSLSAPWLA